MKVAVSFMLEEKLGPYVEAIREVGLDAEPISPRRRRGLEGLRGLVLTGGGDVDPSLYGSEPLASTKHVCRERDDLERELIEEAEQNGFPVLGICRGLQMLNVARGGTLHQHIEGHKDVEHIVRADPESKVAAFVGAEEYVVNSRHHQAVDRLGGGLNVTARAGDGAIEAVEDSERRFVVAVQWHPEERLATRDFRIFSAFAKAVRG
jgi:putative glutamine amidotransferase